MTSTASAFSVSGATVSGGSLVYLGTQTASSSASLVFNQVFSSAYNTYLFVFNNVLPSTDNKNLYMQLATGSTPTYVTTGYNWNYNGYEGTSLGTDSATSGAGTFFPVTGTSGGAVSSSTGGVCGEMHLFGTNGSSAIAIGSVNSAWNYNATTMANAVCSFEIAAAVYTGCKFYFASGNIASGSISMYGVATGSGGGGGTASGAWVQLATSTASSSANVSFTGLTSAYSNYVVVANEIVAGSANTLLYMNFSTNGGSSYDSTSGHYSNMFYGIAAGGAFNQTATPTTNFLLAGQTAGTFGLDTTYPTSGVIHIYNPSAATYINVHSDFALGITGALSCRNWSGGFYNVSSGAVNAIQFTMSSGNIASGKFVLYGVV